MLLQKFRNLIYIIITPRFQDILKTFKIANTDIWIYIPKQGIVKLMLPREKRREYIEFPKEQSLIFTYLGIPEKFMISSPYE